MGCDIHILVEKKTSNGIVDLDLQPFNHRCYGVFGFLANVRNYSMVPCIAMPRGFPTDRDYSQHCDIENDERHNRSWLSIEELRTFDYDQEFEDRRCNGITLAIGEGTQTTIREFLGEWFFEDLQELCMSGADRIVFSFDN